MLGNRRTCLNFSVAFSVGGVARIDRSRTFPVETNCGISSRRIDVLVGSTFNPNVNEGVGAIVNYLLPLRQRTADLDIAIVGNEAKLAELVHKETDAGSSRADHFGAARIFGESARETESPAGRCHLRRA